MSGQSRAEPGLLVLRMRIRSPWRYLSGWWQTARCRRRPQWIPARAHGQCARPTSRGARRRAWMLMKRSWRHGPQTGATSTMGPPGPRSWPRGKGSLPRSHCPGWVRHMPNEQGRGMITGTVYSGARSCESDTAPRRSASLARLDAAVRVARRHAELVVQVREVLLDGGLGDDELVGDRAGRRRLGEHVAGEQRAAQRDEHVALAGGQRRARPPRPRWPPRPSREVAEDQPRLADAHLVAVAQPVCRPDPLAVDARCRSTTRGR